VRLWRDARGAAPGGATHAFDLSVDYRVKGRPRGVRETPHRPSADRRGRPREPHPSPADEAHMAEQHHDSNAGASARREHDRRKARREADVRRRHPRVGGLILAAQRQAQRERRWAHGAEGEELVAAALAQRCGPRVRVLHDRSMPRSRANIDHVAIAPTGVWVVDTKRYKGKIKVAKPLLGSARLEIAGRDRTKLVDGLAKQVEAVAGLVAEIAPGTAVHGVFCFVEGELPLIGTPEIRGFPLLHRRALAKRLNASGPLAPDAITALADALATRLKRA
jgi:hypothetical protein